MKLKALLHLMVGVSVALPASAYEVPTTQQNKNILLEEFTGISCGYCPQGHAIANNLLNAQPSKSYSIAIHAGEFATPSPDEPDFRTEDGVLINKTIGAGFYGTGYPSGMVNRHIFRGSIPITSRGEWIKDGKNISQEIAPVNLLMKSKFDGNTRELTITVEGYYTQNVDKEFNLLNVALTQSNIKGPQNGGLVGSDYIHNHMLRDYITPAWGDTIKAPKQGEYFTRNYTYTLPADIKGVELKAEDIELIAFVCTDKTELLNVTGGKPEYSNYEKPLGATLVQPNQVIKINYGYNFFNAKLTNKSNQPITSADFKVTINGVDKNATWTGNIHAFETGAIKIKIDSYEFLPQNNYKITLSKLNGQAVEGNSLEGSFGAPTESTSKISIEIQTDLYADENTYAIKDQDGNIVKEFGPYVTDKKAVYKETAELEANKVYCFEVTDKWGDGSQLPKGYYKIYNENRLLVFQQYDIKLYGDVYFFRTSLPSNISNPENGTKLTAYPGLGNMEICFTPNVSGDVHIGLYSVSGEEIAGYSVNVNAGEESRNTISTAGLSKGIYIIKIRNAGSIEILKTIIR